MDSDYYLASGSGEPPRKRRAAALAAQKNWQMLNKSEDDIIDIDDDMIAVTQTVQRASLPTPFIATPYSSSAKRTSLPSSVIELNRTKKVLDRDYSPTEDLLRQAQIGPMKAKKTFPTPPAPTAPHMVGFRHPIIFTRTQPQIIQYNVQTATPIRTRGPIMRTPTALRSGVRMASTVRAPAIPKPQTILIETENSSRVITRKDGSQQRRPFIKKNHPSEPQDFPIVEGETEETVGTYNDGQEIIVPDDNDWTDELSLIMFCESEEKALKENQKSKETKDDDIEVIEIIDGKQVINGPQKAPPIRNTYSNLQRNIANKLKGHLDTVIDTLEMDCENLDDQHTDGIWMDCEEDILSESQWKLSEDLTKSYKQYQKSVISTKNVKFLPDAEVEEPIGITTVTVSETTRIITKPVISKPVRIVTGRQNTTQSQSIRAPIPSVGNPIPAQIPSNFTILPIASSSGVTNPLILAPTSFMSTPGTTLPPGLRLILQTRGSNPQPTYVMLSQPSQSVVPTQSIIVSNSNSIYRPNIVVTSGLTAPLRPRIISPQVQTAIRAPVPAVRGRPPIYRVSSRTAVNTSSQLQTRANNNQLFDCLTNFKSASTSNKKINMTTVLTIKPLPFSWPSNIDALINSLIKLDNALMKEKFKESPIAWMVKNSLIVPPKCRICNKGVCNQVSKSANTKNEYWQCNNSSCNRSYVIDRPRIFSGPKFDIPVSKLLFLIYYWSIQVDVDDLIKTGQIEMGTDKIFNVWSRLQKVCSFALVSKESKLGGVNKEVEIASIQIGRFHVLGAMESSTHRTKLTVIPLSEIVQQTGRNAVMLPFVKWIEKQTLIKTCEAKFLSLREFGYKVVCQTKNDFLTTNKNLSLNTISGYLIHHLQRFFKDFDLSTLTHEILSNILDELLWRERFGTNPFAAFYNVIKHISEQCALKKPEYDITVTQKAPTPQTGIRTPPAATYSRPARPIAAPLDETNSVFVEEYYYSSLKLNDNADKVTSQEETSKDGIQCHLCQMFFDNILIIKHLLEHLEKERRGRVRKGDNNETECKHCLRFYSSRAHHMHEELTNLKLVPFSCRICLLPLLARQPFIGHMKTSHFSGEMPYYCDICSYRSSFQKNLFDHFEASHSKCNQIICPFCIRVFDAIKPRNVTISEFLYRHLTTHYAIASVYDCENCVLTFTSKDDLMEHCFKGHNPSNVVDEKFEVTPYVVNEEEKKLCVRAREQELFTPFLPTFGNIGDDKNSNEKETNYNTNNNNNNNNNNNKESEPNGQNVENLEINCDINFDDYLSFEPEVQISLTDESITSVNLILPVDCDYSDDRLKQILTQSFDIEADDEKNLISYDSQRIVCYECRTEMSSEHLCHRMVCEKCQFTTHCKTAFNSHTSDGHKAETESSAKQISVFKPFPQLLSYKVVCNECDFTSLDGNQIAQHMIELNHLNIACKPLKEIKEGVEVEVRMTEDQTETGNGSQIEAMEGQADEAETDFQAKALTKDEAETKSLTKFEGEAKAEAEAEAETEVQTESEVETEVTEGVVDNERTDE